MVMAKIALTSVRFRNVKGLKNFSVALADMNILVGPNNAGKSTIIGAFRVLDAGLRRARTLSPERLGPEFRSKSGYPISADAIPISMENIHTNYEDVDSTVTFRLSNGNELVLLFPRQGGCVMFLGDQSKQVSRPTEFIAAYPLRLGVFPVLGPVEHEEELVQEQTIRRGLSTHRASRHFRSYWWYQLRDRFGYPDDDGKERFNRLAKMVRDTWPGMDLDPPYQPSAEVANLVMFAEEDRIPRELYWAGSGFQVWCQLLTHLLRAEESEADLIVIDEPEIYLHPNLQRQLIQLLRGVPSDVVVATHSTDVINEAEASDVLIVDKKRRSARRVTEPAGVRQALDIIGAARSVVVTQMARTGRALLVEGYDFEILKRWASTLGYPDIATSFGLTPVDLGGFPSPERVRSICEGLRRGLGDDLAIGLLVDRDYRPAEQVAGLRAEFKQHVDLVLILRKKELENYLLAPEPLARAVERRLEDRERRTGRGGPLTFTPLPQLDVVYAALKPEAQAQAIARRIQFERPKGISEATATKAAMKAFADEWTDDGGPAALVAGKLALAELNGWLQANLDISVTPQQIAASFRADEIPSELKNFIRQLSTLTRAKA